MKVRITTALLTLAAVLALSGCAMTSIKDSSLQKRTVSLNVLGVIQFEKTTEGLAIGEAQLVKEEKEEESE